MFKESRGFKWSALCLILSLVVISGCVKKAENELRFEITFPESILITMESLNMEMGSPTAGDLTE
ncbi:MAG: hypothetical protein ACOC5S_00090 [Acidobacteriota bacterium]